MSNAVVAKTLLYMENDGTPGQYDLVAEVRDITGAISLNRAAHEVTPQDSDEKEYKPGKLENGVVGFVVNHVAGNELQSKAEAGTIKSWQVWVSTGAVATYTKYEFDGFVTKYDVPGPVDGTYVGNAEIRRTGAVSVV
jgi:hypothetical protein